jgi:hypothetical protein
VGTSVGHVDDAFRAAGFIADDTYQPPTSGARRSRVEQYYHAINWADREEVDRFLREVIQPILARLEAQVETNAGDEWAPRSLRELTTLLRAEGYAVLDGQIKLVGSVPQALIQQAYRNHDVEALAAMLGRLENTEDDPWLAIGTAKEIVEYIALSIIHEAGQPQPPAGTDFPKLCKSALRLLQLLAEDVPDQKKGADSIRRVLQGLAQVVNGTEELRNLYGTGHGRRRAAKLYGRHARLVVSSALSWAQFVAETWKDRQVVSGGAGTP